MKKISQLVLLFGLGLNLSVYSQIVVKEASKDSVVWKSKLTGLPKLVNFYGENNSYALYYKNLEYQHITEIDYISFKDKETAIDFFNVLKNTGQEQKEVTFDFNVKNYTRWTMNAITTGEFDIFPGTT